MSIVVGWFNGVVKLFATGCPGLVVCATSGTPVETCKTVSTCRGCVGGCTARGTSGNGIALRPEGNAFGDEALRGFPSFSFRGVWLFRFGLAGCVRFFCS